MLLYTMLYIVLAYLMLFAALTNSVCLNNASFFFLFKYFLCQGYELSGEIALKNNHYYYYYYYYINDLPTVSNTLKVLADDSNIFYKHSDPKTIINTINVEMRRITGRFQSNNLHINKKNSCHVFSW